MVKEIGEKDARKLLDQKPTNSDLRRIIQYVEPLREEAGKKLWNQEGPISDRDLHCIIEYVDSLRDMAKNHSWYKKRERV
ncbi:hypothetical protein KAR26_03725 [Candidatus Parcubacteria bacterium]|nr:hypothetical protein [Candidatus Parcubacteria bacterium]MCK5592040.1 hypothetical protein [Candidatus Paceibacterota bacterium]